MKDLHRGHAVEVEHERHSKLGECPDERDRAAGKDPWHNKRKRDFSELAESGAAEIFRRFAHGRIDVGKGCQNVQIKDGIKVKGVHRDDSSELASAEPVHRM